MQLIPPLEIALCLIVTLYTYMHVIIFFSFWGLVLGLLAKGPFFFAAVVFFAEQ